jgi:phage terminase large subunit-like protein
VGGRGSGKSWTGAYDLICRARPGRCYLVASPTGVLLHDTTFPTFQKLAQDLHVWKSVKLTPYPTVQLGNGATIRFRTAEDPEKLRGPNLSGAWLDEASLMPQAAYTIVIASLREGGDLGWLSATFTPKGLSHWTKEIFGDPARPDTALFSASMRDNPFLHPDFAAKIQAQYGEGSRQALQEIEGKFVSLDGAEWPADYFGGPGFWFEEWPAWLEVKTMALDPSKGADAKLGDYQALCLYGRDKHGTEYVEFDMARRPIVSVRSPEGIEITEGMVEHCVRRAREFRPEGFAVETNQFQQLLMIPFRQVMESEGVDLNLYGIDNRMNKQVRIRRWGNPLGQRRVRFRNTPGTRVALAQFQDFPAAEFDDGPDAGEVARRLAVELFNLKAN